MKGVQEKARKRQGLIQEAHDLSPAIYPDSFKRPVWRFVVDLFSLGKKEKPVSLTRRIQLLIQFDHGLDPLLRQGNEQDPCLLEGKILRKQALIP